MSTYTTKKTKHVRKNERTTGKTRQSRKSPRWIAECTKQSNVWFDFNRGLSLHTLSFQTLQQPSRLNLSSGSQRLQEAKRVYVAPFVLLAFGEARSIVCFYSSCRSSQVFS
mmetsp:Transcript_32262/g.74113  ORF Transcript_32262/g.74113 Transcript_32262/m.74113 type:complete len:111 (+) Transcript_32262:26-358(+)